MFFAAKCPIIAPAKESPAPVGSTTDSKENPTDGKITNWKWWKTPTEFNEAEAREELIDIWHFVVQASLELNLTPDDILKEYERKNEINRQRQKDGY